MSDSKVYFITGANRGVGLGLVKALKNEGTIFATARKPEAATELNALAKEHKNIHVLKLEITSKSQNEEAAALVKKIAGKVDVLILNAGISESYAPITKVTQEDLDSHYKANVNGSVLPFQAIYPLLKEGSGKTVVFISTAAATLSQFIPFITGAYGPSKAAINHIARQIDTELAPEGFKVAAIHPGLVDSDMGKLGVQKCQEAGIDTSNFPLISPEESGSQIAKTVNGLDKTTGAEFLNYDGTSIPW